MDLGGTPEGMEGGSSTGSTGMSSAPSASAGQPLQERKAVKSVIDQYLDMLTERQKQSEEEDPESVMMLIENSERESEKLDTLLESVENLIEDKEDILKEFDGEEDPQSGDTVADEDLIDDEE